MTFDLQNIYTFFVTVCIACQLIVVVAKLDDHYNNGELSEELDTFGDKRNHFLPTFLPTPSNITYNRGEEAVLQCAIENRGTRTIVWRKASDPNPLTIGMDTYIGDSRFKVVHKKHSLEWNLHITDAKPEDSGVYECQVSAKRRHIRQNVLLTVLAFPRKEAPERPTFRPEITIKGTLFVERGDTLKLTCNATGSEYPPDALDWFKDGDKIKNNERITLSSDVSLSDRTISSTLSIRRSNMSDAGTYVCRTYGNLVTSAKVNILNTGTNNEKRESVDMTVNPSRSRSGSSRCASPSCHILFALLCLTIMCFRGQLWSSKHSL